MLRKKLKIPDTAKSVVRYCGDRIIYSDMPADEILDAIGPSKQFIRITDSEGRTGYIREHVIDAVIDIRESKE